MSPQSGDNRVSANRFLQAALAFRSNHSHSTRTLVKPKGSDFHKAPSNEANPNESYGARNQQSGGCKRAKVPVALLLHVKAFGFAIGRRRSNDG